MVDEVLEKPWSAKSPRFDFHDVSVAASHNEQLKRSLDNSVVRQHKGRQLRILDLPKPDDMRQLAGDIKQHTLDYLDYYLEQTVREVEKNGGKVHFASTGAEATRIILDIARENNCKRVIKSKSMVSEEIDLAHAMEAAGLDVVETDLGEYIIQVAHDKPSHLVTPCVHWTKAQIAELLSKKFDVPYNDDPNYLCGLARRFLRDKFRHSDLGITGGNFIVAETGQVVGVENEGNQRQSLTTPKILVSLVGIEKVVPRMVDLAVMLKLLSRSATGQPITIYNNIVGGPRDLCETDGPEQFHLVLMDNGRTEILASEEYRETLRCIRCGACLNACPIYRKIGGHAYGSVYPGPIGALITPLMKGLGDYKDLPNASSLCGACYEACPVKINIPKHLINLRRDINTRKINSVWERLIYKMWAKSYMSVIGYKLAGFFQRWDFQRRAGDSGWVTKLPFPASGWTQIRDMPAPPDESFRHAWRRRKQ